VVVAVRNVAKAERLFPSGVEIRTLDTEDLDSVRSFATAWGDRPLDLLLNNAGISAVPWRLSPQGVESQFATNFLGHFALTGLLLPHLRGGARVVNVSSALYLRAKALPLDDPAARQAYSPFGAYNASKLANLLFGLELERRLRASGRPIHSFVAHPGVAGTPMMTHSVGAAARALVPVVSTLVARHRADPVRRHEPGRAHRSVPRAVAAEVGPPGALRRAAGARERPRAGRPAVAGGAGPQPGRVPRRCARVTSDIT
jgi:NAD(P)-dependent dehydrogenase (short-subunit alcohol dehydrogenase family)